MFPFLRFSPRMPARCALPRCVLPLCALLLCTVACQRNPDTDVADSADAANARSNAPAPSPAASAPDASPPPATVGAAYACADGTRLRASFGEHDATLQWPDDRTLTLPRAESASKGGGDVYVGETVSLQRDGSRLQLHDGSRAATTCDPDATASATSAAAGSDASAGQAVARYTCDAGVVLARGDDGSYRAEIPGNPPVRLMRIANSTPPVYTGSSLYLRVGEGDAILSQGDRADELHCTAG